jgi:hypothetical protein
LSAVLIYDFVLKRVFSVKNKANLHHFIQKIAICKGLNGYGKGIVEVQYMAAEVFSLLIQILCVLSDILIFKNQSNM